MWGHTKILYISSCLLASSFSPPLQSHTKFSSRAALQLFETDPSFRDRHMVVTCKLRLAQFRISTQCLIDTGASGYAFMDQNFALQNNLVLHRLRHPRVIRAFDGEPSSSGYVTHLAEAIMDIQGHVERIFFHLTGLKQYTIVLGLPWLCRHGASVNFEELSLTFASQFCLKNCTPSPVKILTEAEQALMPKESYDIKKSQALSQLSQSQTLALPLTRKESTRSQSPIQKKMNCFPALRELVPTQKESIQSPAPTKLVLTQEESIQSPSPDPSGSIWNQMAQTSHDDEYSRILASTKQGKIPQIKYRSPASLRSRTQRQEWRNQHPVHLDICELGARQFTHLVKPHEDEESAFSLSLMEIDRYLGIQEPIPARSIKTQVRSKLDPEPNLLPSFAPRLVSHPDSKLCAYDQAYAQSMFRMNQELHLASAITQEELQAYRDNKNVDPALLLPKSYHEYLDVFSRKDADTLPPHRSYDHEIKLKEGQQPPSSTLYGMSRDEILELRRYLDENLAKGFIRASRSHAASPVLFVKKPGGGLRFCVDYRGLNAITVKNRYPLPLISETLNRLCRAKVFTKLDIISAFNRLRIKEGNEELTAFRTRFGLFEYLVMPFGLCNGPASFQHYINDTLRDYLDEICTAYLDDILIYSDIEAEHEIHVKRVLARLRDAGLQADITKCEFHVKEVTYLGLIVTTEGVKMDPKKTDTVINWPQPVNVKDIQSFLGFANFYRRFIYGFSKLAAPLTALTKKGTPFEWSLQCQSSFEALKKAFTSDRVLRHFDPDRKIVVETDASDYVSGGILSQYDNQGTLRPVAYFSKKHNPAECNYEIYDKELMAIVRAFEEWRPELEGSAFPVEVISDHKNLEYFTSSKELSRRQARWSEFLSRFDYKITYRPGKAGVKPDALTRRSGDLPKEGDRSDPRRLYQHQTVLKKANLTQEVQEDYAQFKSSNPLDLTFLALSMTAPVAPATSTLDQGILVCPFQLHLAPTHLAPMELDPEPEPQNLPAPAEPELDGPQAIDPDENLSDTPTHQLWDLANQSDEFAPQVLEMLRSGARYHSGIPLAECEERDGALYFRGKRYVPNSNKLRLRLIQLAHDSVAGGHPGRSKCYELVSRAYWWPNVYSTVQRFVRNCHTCRRSKPSRQRVQGWLRPLPPPQRRWRDVSMDYVGPLPPSTFMGITYRYVLVFVDRLSKMRHLVPTTSMEVNEACDAFYNSVWKLHGLPDILVSDRGSQFTSDVWEALCKRLRIDTRMSTGYHPQTDGQTERFNAVMEHYLRAYVNYMQDDWAQWLPGAEFSSNNTESSSTLASPFMANSGQHPRVGFEPAEPLPQDLSSQARAKLIAADDFADRMEEMNEHLRDEMLIAQAIFEASANRRRRPCPRYLVDDQVWLNAKNLNTARPSVKLDDHNVGPFRVRRVFNNPLVIQLDLPETMKIHPVFHASLLQHAANDPLPGQQQPAREPVIAEDGEREWYVDSILNSKIDRRYNPPLLKYFVNWEGHVPTWEPFNFLTNCNQAIEEYHASYPNAVGPHILPCAVSGCRCRNP